MIRPLNAEEEAKLRLFYKERYGYTPEEAEEINLEFVGVIDNYITDGPGYAGKVFFCVASGYPSMYEVLIEQNEKLQVLEKEL